MDNRQVIHDLTLFVMEHIPDNAKPEDILKLINDSSERYRNISELVEKALNNR